MGRELVLLRHAEAAKDPRVARDFDQPLSAQGRTDAERVGVHLNAEDVTPRIVVCSTALRARQTAEAVCQALDFDLESVVWEDRVYNAEAATLLQLVGTHAPDDGPLLLIGHNPGLEDLLEALCGPVVPRDDGRLLTPAAVARIELPDEDEIVGACRLAHLVRPDEAL